MGRRKGPLPPLDTEIVRAAFVVRDDGAIVRRSTGADATFMGPSGALMIRAYHQGTIRRLIAARIAWALSTGEWPEGVVQVRDGDERNLSAANLIMTKRGPRPFVQSAGGKGSSLARRRAADAELLAALAEHQGAFTVPQLSVSVGQSAPCCCVRLAKLESQGLVCGPHCDARKRWDLTSAGQALAKAAMPLLIDDTDKRILVTLTLTPMRLTRLAAEIGCCNLTVRRRIDALTARSLTKVDELHRYAVTDQGRAAVPDAPPKWLRIEAVAASLAKDVVDRSSPVVMSSQERARLGGLARARQIASEAASSRRSARLIENRSPLRRRLAQMDAGNLEIAPVMADRMDFRRIGEDAPCAVAQDRIVVPASFPQLVADLHIFVGDVVAIVVRALTAETDVLRAAIEIGRDDVPPSASLCQMVEGREAARERVGVLEGKRSRQPEAEMLGDERHRGHELQGIVDGDLRRVTKRSVEGAMVHVVDAKHVRYEQAVELPALQNLSELDPIFEVLVLPRTVARMRP